MRGLLGALGGARLARLSWSKTRACPLGSRPAFARRRAQEHTGVGALGPVVLASRAFSPAWAGPLEACSRTGQSRAFAEALPPAIDTLAECAPRPFRLCRGFWSLCQRRPRFRPGLRVLLSCCRASSSPSRRWRSSLCSCPGCETCSAAAAAMAAHCDAGVERGPCSSVPVCKHPRSCDRRCPQSVHRAVDAAKPPHGLAGGVEHCQGKRCCAS